MPKSSSVLKRLSSNYNRICATQDVYTSWRNNYLHTGELRRVKEGDMGSDVTERLSRQNAKQVTRKSHTIKGAVSVLSAG